MKNKMVPKNMRVKVNQFLFILDVQKCQIK